MNCLESRKLLHAYIDGELDLVRCLEVEEHLKSCTQCVAGKNSLQSLRSALQNSVGDLAYSAPDSLRNKVRQMAYGSNASDATTRSTLPPSLKLWWTRKRVHKTLQPQWFWKWLAMGATVVAALAIFLRPAPVSEREQLMNEAVAGHVRSLMANHLTDVESSDRHTVKPWFDGKLDFAPTVKDFADRGFPLIGGRLDYLDGRAVAALVYRRDKHIINVFIWPANSASATAAAGAGTKETENYHGYNTISFGAGGFQYCLVSDVEEKELERLAGLLQN
jgi:anti-sigma factor RsiW